MKYRKLINVSCFNRKKNALSFALFYHFINLSNIFFEIYWLKTGAVLPVFSSFFTFLRLFAHLLSYYFCHLLIYSFWLSHSSSLSLTHTHSLSLSLPLSLSLHLSVSLSLTHTLSLSSSLSLSFSSSLLFSLSLSLSIYLSLTLSLTLSLHLSSSFLIFSLHNQFKEVPKWPHFIFLYFAVVAEERDLTRFFK